MKLKCRNIVFFHFILLYLHVWLMLASSPYLYKQAMNVFNFNKKRNISNGLTLTCVR